MQCPAKYLKQPSPKPVVPIRIAIIGPPKSGKTTRKYKEGGGGVRALTGSTYNL
jgi:adenylate/nucleoside-diphosphate kinase